MESGKGPNGEVRVNPRPLMPPGWMGQNSAPTFSATATHIPSSHSCEVSSQKMFWFLWPRAQLPLCPWSIPGVNLPWPSVLINPTTDPHRPRLQLILWLSALFLYPICTESELLSWVSSECIICPVCACFLVLVPYSSPYSDLKYFNWLIKHHDMSYPLVST